MSDTEKVMTELAPLLPLLRSVERRLYAAMAMQGMMSVESTAWNESMGLIAGQAVAMADALLAELERTEPS